MGSSLHGRLLPRAEGIRQFEFGLIVAGRAKLYVDGKLVIDNWTKQKQGQAFFGTGTVEERGVIDVKPGKSPEILVEFSNITGPRDGDNGGQIIQPAVRIGGQDVNDPEKMMEDAVRIAKEADVAVVVVGLNADWETEGYDRTTLDLPAGSNELVAEVAAANKKTVVVTQSGSAITMPWVDSVPGLVHAWYLGNETGNAIADVLFGKVNPSGKLSLTFPRRLEDVPSYGHFGSENGKVRYGEDLFVGYKHYLYTKTPTLFPFGYGLSYTTFDYSSLSVSKPSGSGADFKVTVSLTVTNSGKVAGSEIVQIYTSIPKTSVLTQVPRALKGFRKVTLAPGAKTTVEVTLDKYAVSYWEERLDCWLAEAGEYTVYAAASSEDVRATATFTIDEEFEWNGL